MARCSFDENVSAASLKIRGGLTLELCDDHLDYAAIGLATELAPLLKRLRTDGEFRRQWLSRHTTAARTPMASTTK